MRMTLLTALAATTIGGAALAAPQAAPTTKKVEVRKEVRIVNGKEVVGEATAEEQLIASCPAQKFETAVEINADGKKRMTKIKLCAKAGESDAEWVGTLQDAKKRIGTMPDVSPDSRVKITAALDAEIARLAKAN